MSFSRRFHASLLVCAGALVAACGSSNDSTGDDTGGFVTPAGGKSGSSAGGKSGSSGAHAGTESSTGGEGGLGGSDSTGGLSGSAGTSTSGTAGSTSGASGSAGSTTGAAGSTSGAAGATSGSSGAGGIGGDQSFGGAAQGPGPGVGGDAGTGGSAPVCDNGLSSVDDDGDGYSDEAGDCRDCDPAVHPGAIDAPNFVTCTAGDAGCVCDASNNCKAPAPADQQIDESCGHTAPSTCGAGIPLDSPSAVQGANAIDICGGIIAPGDPYYGLLSAKWVRANGADTAVNKQVGVMSTFGTNVTPQLGENMLVLSSGHARTPGQPDACNTQTCTNASGSPPSGFPQDVPNCSGSSNINDDIGLEIQLRAPTNATGFKFRFKFQSFEYAEWVCTSYNDQFIALMSPAPPGAINGNISFDANTNPVSVNIAFFDVCDPNGIGTFASDCFSGSCPNPPNPYCPSGPSQLAGTGFDSWGDAGATSWLVTQAPVTGGEVFTLRFAIWDTGDQALDSTVLIDGFQWIADGTTITVGTGKEDP